MESDAGTNSEINRKSLLIEKARTSDDENVDLSRNADTTYEGVTGGIVLEA